jgi:hypothetical protein
MVYRSTLFRGTMSRFYTYVRHVKNHGRIAWCPGGVGERVGLLPCSGTVQVSYRTQVVNGLEKQGSCRIIFFSLGKFLFDDQLSKDPFESLKTFLLFDYDLTMYVYVTF